MLRVCGFPSRWQGLLLGILMWLPCSGLTVTVTLAAPTALATATGLEASQHPLLTVPQDTAGTSSDRADTIVVRASLVSRQVSLPVSSVSTLVSLEREKGGADLAELLARVAGLQIRRYGGLGAEAVPSIRGSSAAQVVVLIDGIPLADARDGTVDLGNLPLDRFAFAEVYRGHVPVDFGGLGAAGAINLISHPVAAAGTDLHGYTGSFGDVGGRALYSLRSQDDSRAGMVLVHGRRIDNRYEFLDHRQTFANQADDVRRVRWNSQFEEWGGYAGGRLDGSWHATAACGFFRRWGGRPGPLGYESPSATFETDRVDGRMALGTGGQALRLDLMASRVWEWLHDDAGEVGFDPPGTTRGVSSDLTGRLTLTNARQAARVFSGGSRWLVGADWRRQWYHEAHNADADPERARTAVGLFGRLVLIAPGPRLALTPSLRWQRAEDNFPALPALPWLPEEPLPAPHRHEGIAPAVGVIWAALADRLYFEAHAARTQRLPTWVELFGHRGGIAGNRELQPEDITTYDFGCRWLTPGGKMHHRLSLFSSRTRNAIVFLQNSQRTSQAHNFGAAEARGIEWESTLRLPSGGELAANLTWQRARDRGPDPTYRDKELPFLPPLELAVQLDRSWGPWRVGSTVVYEAANYRDRYNVAVERAPARTILNLALGYTWRTGPRGAGWAATVTAETINLTDNVVYDVEGFPLPGRTVRLSVYLR